jgi:hypothetical protein
MYEDILIFLAAIAVWYALMRFILPALGVPTCMSGACQLNKPEPKKEEGSDNE